MSVIYTPYVVMGDRFEKFLVADLKLIRYLAPIRERYEPGVH